MSARTPDAYAHWVCARTYAGAVASVGFGRRFGRRGPRRSRIRGGGCAGIGEALRGALLEFGVGLAERTRELWDLGAAEDDQDHHEDDEELRDADIHTTRVASTQIPGYAGGARLLVQPRPDGSRADSGTHPGGVGSGARGTPGPLSDRRMVGTTKGPDWPLHGSQSASC